MGENVKDRLLFERCNSLEATRHRRKFPFVKGVPSIRSGHIPPATPPAKVADAVRERVERLHCCLCLRQAPCSPLCKSMERRSCNCCQVWPGGRCSRVSTTSARDWRRVAVSPQNPPVLSRTSGSNPKFCRAQRCCMSVCFRFRSVYLSAAARGVVAEGHNTELWNGDVIAQSKANLGDRPQEDFTTTNSTPLFCMLCGKSILICSAHHFHNDALKTLCDFDFYGPPVEPKTVDDDLLLGFDVNILDRTVKYRQPDIFVKFTTVFLRDLSASDWVDWRAGLT